MLFALDLISAYCTRLPENKRMSRNKMLERWRFIKNIANLIECHHKKMKTNSENSSTPCCTSPETDESCSHSEKWNLMYALISNIMEKKECKIQPGQRLPKNLSEVMGNAFFPVESRYHTKGLRDASSALVEFPHSSRKKVR